MTGWVCPTHNRRVDVDAFVRDGFVAVRGAVDTGTLAAGRELVWAELERRGVRRDDRVSWPPLIEGLEELAGEPFVAAYMSPALTSQPEDRCVDGPRPSADTAT